MYLAVGGRFAGLLAVSDPVKASTQKALQALHAAGIRVIMATGDGLTTAKAVASRLGIDEVHGEVKPADKLALVSRLQAEGRVVAMAGDGISYAIGRTFQHRIETVWPFRQYPQWLGRSEAYVEQHGGKSIIVLLNNGMYGTIRMHQERDYPRHVSGSQLSNPDFAALARAYGYAGVRITRTAEFEPELLAALQRDTGTLIEVMLDPDVITTRGTLTAITEQAQLAAATQRRPPATTWQTVPSFFRQ